LFYAISALLLLLTVATQYAWPPWLHIRGARPELALVAVLSIGLMRGPTAGCVAGFVAAYLSASIGSLPMGGQFITLMGIGLLAGLLRGGLFSTRITVAVVASLVGSIAAWLINLILAPPAEPLSWFRLMIMTALSTAVWSIPVFALFRAVGRRFAADTDSY